MTAGCGSDYRESRSARSSAAALGARAVRLERPIRNEDRRPRRNGTIGALSPILNLEILDGRIDLVRSERASVRVSGDRDPHPGLELQSGRIDDRSPMHRYAVEADTALTHREVKLAIDRLDHAVNRLFARLCRRV